VFQLWARGGNCFLLLLIMLFFAKLTNTHFSNKNGKPRFNVLKERLARTVGLCLFSIGYAILQG